MNPDRARASNDKESNLDVIVPVLKRPVAIKIEPEMKVGDVKVMAILAGLVPLRRTTSGNGSAGRVALHYAISIGGRAAEDDENITDVISTMSDHDAVELIETSSTILQEDEY